MNQVTIEYKSVKIEGEENIPIPEVAGIVSKLYGGEPVTKQAVYQWINEGRKGRSGGTVKLQTRDRRGRMYTTIPWIKTFVESL